MKEGLRIVFMGSPDFALESLKTLAEANKNIVAVVTAPDKPKGRGRQLQGSAVKNFAESLGLPILQPTNLKNPAFIQEIQSYKADVQWVVAFRMLPEVVWNMPPLGTFNLHASLLPQYRGAAPINWAIINGETQSGLTTFKLQHEIDTGSILFQEKTEILPKDNFKQLYDKMKLQGAKLVLRSHEAIERNIPQLKEQVIEEPLQKAPKLNSENIRLSNFDSCLQLHNKIRGLSPYPAARLYFEGQNLKILESTYKIEAHPHQQGSFEIFDRELRLYTKDGFLKILHLQVPGKKPIKAQDYINGRINQSHNKKQNQKG